MNDEDPLFPLTFYLAVIALISLGGINGALPDMHRLIVDDRGWLTDQQFTAYFALAQAAPGPNFLFATVLGWHIAGLAGALLSTFAVCGPPSMIAFVAAYSLRNAHDAPTFKKVRRALVPVTLGLITASGFFLTQASATSWGSYAITAGAAGLMLYTRFNPLWGLAAGGALGLLGLV